MVQVLPRKHWKANGHAKGVWNPARVRKMLAARKRNARLALREGRSYGQRKAATPAKGGRRSPNPRLPAQARGHKRAGLSDALVYLAHARRKALQGLAGPDPGEALGPVYGLLELALEALEGRG
jgi:hypothetical protein